MEEKTHNTHRQNPLFPFSVHGHLEGLASGQNQSAACKIVFLKQGRVIYTSVTMQKEICKPALFFLSPRQHYILKPLGRCQGAQLSYCGEFLDQLLLLCWKHGQIRQFIKEYSHEESQESHRLLLLSQAQVQQITIIFHSMQVEAEQCKPGFELIIIQLVLRLWILLYRNGPAETRSTPAIWQIDDLIRHIQHNYASEFSLAAMAEKYSFSPSYFSRRFKEKTGMPLFEYINTIRIQKACLLLKRSQESIIEIAYAVGYNNLSFFNRYFKKIMHMSPREYRNYVQR